MRGHAKKSFEDIRQKNVIKLGIKLAIELKKNLTVNLQRTKKYLRTKIKSCKSKIKQVFIMMKYQKKILIAFAYR